MKFIATADIHLRETAPRYRKDQFQVAQYKKVQWILKQSQLYKVPILIAGDIFNSPKSPYTLTNSYMELFRDHPQEIYVVAGQHDQRYHVESIANTPLGTLVIGDALSMESTKDIQMASWGEKYKKSEKLVLLIHKCITPKAPPFFLEDAISAEQMLRNNPGYQFIISGDYHIGHTTQTKDGRWLINPGCIMRTNKDQIGYKPRIYCIDTNKNTVTPLYIPIAHSEDVFDFARIQLEDKTDQKVISELVQAIQVKTNRPNYQRILQQVIEQAKPSKGVRDVITNILSNN